MDFDFTDELGNGLEVEAERGYGIFVTVTSIATYAGTNITPDEARRVATALNACADHMEDK